MSKKPWESSGVAQGELVNLFDAARVLNCAWDALAFTIICNALKNHN